MCWEAHVADVQYMFVFLQVMHVLMENGVRFFVSATKNIAAGMEISLPLNLDYHKWYEQWNRCQLLL